MEELYSALFVTAWGLIAFGSAWATYQIQQDPSILGEAEVSE